MSTSVPQLNFQVVNYSGDGFPTLKNEAFEMMLDQAVAGGDGTSGYLEHMLKFADLANYLNEQGIAAYTQQENADGSLQANADDGYASLSVNLQLNEDLMSGDVGDDAIAGLATVQMELPDPTKIVKVAQFGITLAEIPAGLVVTRALWQALFSPLLKKITKYVQTSIEGWLEIDVGEDVAILGDEIADVALTTAEDIAEEAAEVVVEEAVLAELSIDFAIAAPAFAVLGILIAVPVLVKALGKQFVLHIEVDNATDYDFTWTMPYLEEGSMTAQPATATIPKMSQMVDMFGDVTGSPVIYEADFSAMNTSGYEGIGFAMNFSPSGVSGQDIAAVISIPWITKNGLWLGDPGNSPDWKDIYDDHQGGNGEDHVSHGNQKFYATLAIDALSGNSDEYHCVLRIEPL